MDGYAYNAGYGANAMDEAQHYGGQDTMMMDQNGMGPDMVGGQSLDEIVNQNADAIRRQSMEQQYGVRMGNVDPSMGRVSMMDYGSGSPATAMTNFGYDGSAGIDRNAINSGVMAAASSGYPSHLLERRRQSQNQSQTQSRRQSGEDLALDTNISNHSRSYSAMIPPAAAFASPAHPQSGMEMTSPYIDPNIGMSMDLTGAQMGDETMNMDMYNQPQFSNSIMTSPMHSHPQNTTPISASRGPVHDAGGGNGMNNMRYGSHSGHSSGSAVRASLSRSQSLQTPEVATPAQASTPISQPVAAAQPHQSHNAGFPAQPQHPQPGSQQDRGMHIGRSTSFDAVNGPTPVTSGVYNPNNQGFAWDAPEGGWPSTMSGRTHMQSVYKNAYSSTGFDMLGVLVRLVSFTKLYVTH